MAELPPLPDTVSAAARDRFDHPAPGLAGSLAERRAADTANLARISEAQRRQYQVTVADEAIAGIPVRRFTPNGASAGGIMIALHGGGFILGSDSAENIPVACLTGVEVISVLYRLAPEHPYPAAVDDVIAVYRALLEQYEPAAIALFGSSAGAILASQVVARALRDGLPAPAALGFFTGAADLSCGGDAWAIFGPRAAEGSDQPMDYARAFSPYVGAYDPKDPGVSPIYGPLYGFPPTLCVTGTRDFLLSQTCLFAQALRRAKVPVQLEVFEGMPHGHWGDPDLPESQDAFDIMAAFLGAHLRHGARL
jgi:acetyl esterase/lipase